MRAAMMEISNIVALKNKCQAIITGEALSQVASQTIEALSFTDFISDLLVFRPLIGLDKEEIIKISRNIGTFETSILPYDDCCVLFSPKHPLVKPNKMSVLEHYKDLHLDELMVKAIEDEEIIQF